MRILLQRVSKASVAIENVPYSTIGYGALILAGFVPQDTQEDYDWVCKKLFKLRIFKPLSSSESESKSKLVAIEEAKGEFLIVSQFTLSATIKKGNSPSYSRAATPQDAMAMYSAFIAHCRSYADSQSAKDSTSTVNILEGKFGANMQVSLVNDGPYTLIIDSKNRNL